MEALNSLWNTFFPLPFFVHKLGVLNSSNPKQIHVELNVFTAKMSGGTDLLGGSSKHPLVSNPKQQGLKVLGDSIPELRAPFLLGCVGNLFMD